MNTDSDQCPICDGTLRLCGSPGSNLAVGNSVSAYGVCETV